MNTYAFFFFFFFKQKTAYEMRISDWSSDVCSSDLLGEDARRFVGEVEVVAGAVPLPAADVRQRLHAVEQGAVALEFGDVAEHRQHLVRPVGIGRVLRHHSDRQPAQLDRKSTRLNSSH